MMTPYGVREICDVVLKAKKNMTIGSRNFYKDEPVIYFDTLKTSTLEGAATTVYANGGRGNARLIAWEGERTVTFTMEDALISPAGFMILSGADLIEAKEGESLPVHATENVVVSDDSKLVVSKVPYDTKEIVYVMKLDNDGHTISEPYLCKISASKEISIASDVTGYSAELPTLNAGDVYLVDYYYAGKGVQQIEIPADKFGGNYYLEASTLFRDEDGKDVPAEFIIPNCKVQSNFTFTMASSGDPSAFTFTMDAFPDETKHRPGVKVLAALQVIKGDDETVAGTRTKTQLFEKAKTAQTNLDD